jgi:hypothetical protein
MKLPNGAQAIIDRRKIAEYSLSPTHEDGQHKARLFASLVGLTVDDADELIEALRAAAEAGQATIGKIDKYGERYLIDFEFRGRIGSARIRSVWMVRTNETVPRLVTCYIL